MPYLDEHARAIGYLCIFYSALEDRVNQSLEILSGLDEDLNRVYTNQIDLKKKIPILNALAFTKRPSEQWYRDIETVSWAIIEWVSPKRNRFVHDQWLSLPSGAVRFYQRTRIRKPQSRQPLTLTTGERIPQFAGDIWALVDETKEVSNLLRHLTAAYKSGRAQKEPDTPLLRPYLDVWRDRQKRPRESNSKEPGE